MNRASKVFVGSSAAALALLGSDVMLGWLAPAAHLAIILIAAVGVSCATAGLVASHRPGGAVRFGNRGAAQAPAPSQPSALKRAVSDPRTELHPDEKANEALLAVCPICGMEDAERFRLGVGTATWHGWPAHASCLEWLGERPSEAVSAAGVTAEMYVQLHVGLPGPSGMANLSSVTTRQLLLARVTPGGLVTMANRPAWERWDGGDGETVTHLSLWDDPRAGYGKLLSAGALRSPARIRQGERLDLDELSLVPC